jgi:hypothetical protein
MALVLAATLLTACASTPSKQAGPACPSLPEYTPEQQDQAADELERMPPGSIIADLFIPDYGRMRDGVRACQKAQEDGARP